MKTVVKSLQFIQPIEQKKTKEYMKSMISKGVLAILFLIGFAENLAKLFLPKTLLSILVIISLLSCILFTFVLENKKIRLLGLIIVLLWLMFFCVILHADIFNGLRLCGNHMGDVLGRRFGQIYPIYSVTIEAGDYALAATLFFIPIGVLLSLLCSYIAQTCDLIVSLILIAVIIFVNAFLGISFSAFGLGILVLAQAILFFRRFGMQKNFYGIFSKSFHIGTLLTGLAFVFCAVISFFAVPSYEKSPFVSEKNEFIRYVDRLRYGVDSSLCMPDGNFTNLQRFEPSKKTALEVTMEKSESLWLRGYVGSVYNGHGWSDDSAKNLYEKADLFYWLHKGNFYGQKQLVDAALVSGKELANHSFGLRINNIGASSRNIYAPYEFYYANKTLMSENTIGDKTLDSPGFFGQRKYEYVSLPNIVKHYPDVLNGLYGKSEQTASIEAFLHIESNYADFVYQNYTEIPKSTKVWMKKYLTEITPQKENVNFTAAKQAIITYLSEKTSYGTNPARSTSSDFVYDFLISNRTGYSVHYATAATLMFRYLGIPARYVEGYLITPKDVKKAQDNVVLKLDGTHAHAWTEVYLDGAGWIPVEVTPPYFGLMEEADSFEGVQGGTYDADDGETKEENSYKSQDDILDLDETEGIKNTALPWILIIIVILLVVLIICFVLYYLKKRRVWMNKRLMACNAVDNRVAIKAMFVCAMEALTALGLESEGVWLIHSLKTKIESNANSLAEELEKEFHCYERAVYSSLSLSDEDRIEMQRFLDEILLQLQEYSTGFKRLKNSRLMKLFSKIGTASNTRK